jgi:hypothetical protein
MKKFIVLMIVVLFSTGCAHISAPRIDLSNIQSGCSMEEVKARIPAVPEIKSVPSFAEELSIFALEVLPETKKASFDREGFRKHSKKFQRWNLLLYQVGNESLWFFFDEKNKLWFSGKGPEEIANYEMYKQVTTTVEEAGEITHAQARTLEYKKFRTLESYKNNPYSSVLDEYCKYRIMLAEKLDNKQITKKGFDYLSAQKENELRERAYANLRSRRRGLTRSQAAGIAIGSMGYGIQGAFQSYANGLRGETHRGTYRGRLSNNPYLLDSTSNPYGRYGSPYSPDSINNPYGAGSPYKLDSPNNLYGTGLEIYGD